MYKIEDACQAHAEQIAAVHTECWKQCYDYLPQELHEMRSYDVRLRQWQGVLSHPNPKTCCLVLIDGEDVVGFAYAKENFDEDIPSAKSEFHACYFLQRYRRTAAGPMMLAALIRWSLASNMTPFCVWAWKKNPIRLTYASLGLVPVVARERQIEGFSEPEIGYISHDVEASSRRLDRMISRVSYRAGTSENQQPSRPRQYPTVLRAGKDRQSVLRQ